MSKRASSTAPAIRVLKYIKMANVWDTIPDGDEKTKEFKPVEGGPKTKVSKSFVLNYKPRMDATIALNGCDPEVRFVTPEGNFYMSGEEFLHFSGAPQGSSSLDTVCLEPMEEDFRLARYRPTESGMPSLLPVSVLALNKYAAKRLKAKLSMMVDHVSALRDSEDVIRLMFDCVADVYREEYQLSHSLIPITDQFSELSRLVETYVPAVIIVKAFLDKLHDQRLLSSFNHYHLCAVVSAQKHFILDLLKSV